MTTALQALARGATVVTATRRLARHLRHRHDNAMRDSGRLAWPAADVLPWEAWLGRLWEPLALNGANDLLTMDELRLLWARVIDEQDVIATDADALTSLALGSWRLCEDWNLDSDQLARHAESVDHLAFARWTEAFRRHCDAAGRAHRGAVMTALAVNPPPLSGQDVCFAGFESWPAAHERMAEGLRQAGIAVSFAVEPAIVGGARRLRCTDADDELRQAAAWARAELTRDPGLRIGVIVPDLAERGTQVRRALLDALLPGWQLDSPASPPLAVSLGRPLAAYPVVHAALLGLSLAADTVEWQQVGQLLRSRYLGGADLEREARIAIDLRLRRYGTETMSPHTLLARCRDTAPAFAAALETLFAAFDGPRTAAPGWWARRISDALTGLGWPGDRSLDDTEFQATVAWQSLLETISTWDDLVGPLSLPSMLALVRDLAGRRVFEPAGSEEGVQVMGLREATGQTFDRLWIAGVTAERCPPSPRPDPLLPMAIQRQLGLPDAVPELAREQAERQFRLLLGSAPEVVASWPSRQSDEELAMSPWLASFTDLAPAPAAGCALDRDVVAGSALLESDVPDPPPPLDPDAGLAAGTRLLTCQSQCPARAFAEFRLGARELEQPEPMLASRMRGNLVHRLLERLYGQQACRQGLCVPDERELRSLFVEVLPAVLDEFLPGRDPSVGRLRMLEEHRLWQLVMLLRELDETRRPFTVQVEEPWQKAFGPVVINMRHDRLETFPTGSQVVVDYKTGQFSTGGWRAERLAECQLPLYAIAGDVSGIAVLQFGPGTAKLTGVVGEESLELERRVISPAKFMKDDEATWSRLVARWERQLNALAAEFVAGDFRVNPDERKPAEGQYAALTRVHELGWAEEGEE